MAEQTITLPASIHTTINIPGNINNGHSQWLFDPADRVEIDSDLRQGNAFFSRLLIPSSSSDGGNADRIILNFESNQEVGLSTAHLSDAAEASGVFTLSASGVSPDLNFGILGADMSEPYVWTPTNLSEIETWVDAFQALGTTPAASFTLRDEGLVPIVYFAPDASNLNQATGIHYAPDANTLREVTAMYYAPDANTLNQVM